MASSFGTFPLMVGQIWSEERDGCGPLAVTLVVISCFQQLWPSIQGVTAGTSGNEMISRACVFKSLLASFWPLLAVLLGSFRVYWHYYQCDMFLLANTKTQGRHASLPSDRAPGASGETLVATTADLPPGSEHTGSLIWPLKKNSHLNFASGNFYSTLK